MEIDDARALIAGAVPATGDGAPRWADLGAGTGTFTRALATLLGPRGRVAAVDRDASALATLARARRDGAAVVTVRADLTDPRLHATLGGALGAAPLDGILLANALHFVAADAQAAVLARLAGWLRPGGRLVVVEYENRAPSRWVPAPVSLARLAAIVPAGVRAPVPVGSRRSAFGGSMYAAYAERRADAG